MRMFLKWATGWRKRRAIAVEPVRPPLDDLNHLVINEDGISLIGPDLEALPDSVATYTCPKCLQWHNVPLKQYLYLNDMIIPICAHVCTQTQEPQTDALFAVEGGIA